MIFFFFDKYRQALVRELLRTWSKGNKDSRRNAVCVLCSEKIRHFSR